MTLLNVRLGSWIPNPGLLEEKVGRKAAPKGEAGGAPGFSFGEVFEEELKEIERRWEQSARRLRSGAWRPGTAPRCARPGRHRLLRGRHSLRHAQPGNRPGASPAGCLRPRRLHVHGLGRRVPGLQHQQPHAPADPDGERDRGPREPRDGRGGREGGDGLTGRAGRARALPGLGAPVGPIGGAGGAVQPREYRYASHARLAVENGQRVAPGQRLIALAESHDGRTEHLRRPVPVAGAPGGPAAGGDGTARRDPPLGQRLRRRAHREPGRDRAPPPPLPVRHPRRRRGRPRAPLQRPRHADSLGPHRPRDPRRHRRRRAAARRAPAQREALGGGAHPLPRRERARPPAVPQVVGHRRRGRGDPGVPSRPALVPPRVDRRPVLRRGPVRGLPQPRPAHRRGGPRAPSPGGRPGRRGPDAVLRARAVVREARRGRGRPRGAPAPTGDGATGARRPGSRETAPRTPAGAS